MKRNILIKRAIILMIIAGIIISLSPNSFFTVSFASSPSIKLMVNGSTVYPDVPPQIINNRVMVPVRWVAEALGATVNWDSGKKAVLVNSSSNQVDKVGDITIRLFVDGKEIKPDVAPQIINDRVMVPVRWIAEALGANVEWDGCNYTVYITLDRNNSQTRRIIIDDETVYTFEPGELYIATSYNRIYQHSREGTERLLGQYIRQAFPNLKFKIIDWDYINEKDWKRTNVYPDIYITLSKGANGFQSYDLTPLIGKCNFDTSRLNKCAMNSIMDSGKSGIYCLPLEVNDHILYYNKKYFDMRNEPYPVFGMTYDEAYEKAQRLTFTYGYNQVKGYVQHPDVYMSSNQRCLYPMSSTLPKRVQLCTQEFIDLVDNLRRFYKISGNLWVSTDDFTKLGIAAMCVDSLEKLHYLATVKEYLSESDYKWYTSNKDNINDENAVFKVPSNWDISTIPVFPEAPVTIYQNTGLACYISRSSQMKETAFEVIAYLLTDEVQKKRAADGIKGSVKTEDIASAFGTNVPEYKNLNLKAVYWGENAYIPSQLSTTHSDVNLWLVFRKYIFQYGMSTETALKRVEDEENKRLFGI